MMWWLLLGVWVGSTLTFWWFLAKDRVPHCACGLEPIITGHRVVDTRTGMLHTPERCSPVTEEL